MELTFAGEKFAEAEAAFIALQARASKERFAPFSPEEVESVQADLDAAIPGLDGGTLARALLLKGLCGDLLIRASATDLSFAAAGQGDRIARDALTWIAKARALFAKHEPDLVPRVDEAAESLRFWLEKR